MHPVLGEFMKFRIRFKKQIKIFGKKQKFDTQET